MVRIDTYKGTRAHNQGRQLGRQQEEISGFEEGLDEEG
jgi:hypothetical protein